MPSYRNKSVERWLKFGITSLCVVAISGCAVTQREWPPAPEWLWQDKSAQKIVVERYSEGLSKEPESIAERAEIELLARNFVNGYSVNMGGREKTSITKEKFSCPRSYECIVDLTTHHKRWDGYIEHSFYLVFIKSSEWSLRHVYRSGAGSFITN